MEIYHGIGGKIWDAREEFLEEMTFKWRLGVEDDLCFLNVEFYTSSFTLKRLFSSSSRHKGGVICISEVIDISPGNLDSSLCFIQPVFHMMRIS